jgi:hypothetical protein
VNRLLALGCCLSVVACGHTPIEAHSIPKPVLVGPVRHLAARRSAPQSPIDEVPHSVVPAGGTRPFSFTSVVSTQSYSVGVGTVTDQRTSKPGSFGAAVDYATAGHPEARLEIETISCTARFSFPVFYANSTEQCTVEGTLTLGPPARDAGGRGPRQLGPGAW